MSKSNKKFNKEELFFVKEDRKLLNRRDRKKFKEFMPKQFKIICFPGHYKHYQNYPKTGRRVVGAFTFK